MVTTNWVMGLWKFPSRIELFQIIETAKDLVKTDSHYVQVYVRKSSKKQYSIGFAYDLTNNQEAEMGLKNFTETTEHWLHARFGNDLIGHDIAAPIYLIK
jgi:hypothetical protein